VATDLPPGVKIIEKRFEQARPTLMSDFRQVTEFQITPDGFRAKAYSLTDVLGISLADVTQAPADNDPGDAHD
jgi:hypothetical protein